MGYHDIRHSIAAKDALEGKLLRKTSDEIGFEVVDKNLAIMKGNADSNAPTLSLIFCIPLPDVAKAGREELWNEGVIIVTSRPTPGKSSNLSVLFYLLCCR